MSAITPFNFDSKTIRVVTDENGEPLFVGKDVCDALGYANASDAIKQHCKGVAKRYPLQTATHLLFQQISPPAPAGFFLENPCNSAAFAAA